MKPSRRDTTEHGASRKVVTCRDDVCTLRSNSLQARPAPTRIYEPNIIHNPFTWMGIWTPHGWRVHHKRFGKAQRVSITLSGDGQTTFFPEALLDPRNGRVEWQDDLHLRDDPFTDTGHYPCDPRVEYPPGRPRWAISHTLLCHPVADHTLYTHEYTWDMTHGHLQTHFREHVALEEARTDKHDGTSVAVAHKPISRAIEGNARYPLPNSAVRGVWADPGRRSPNLYTRRVTQLIAMHNAVYGIMPHHPVVQCHGIWPVLPDDPLGEAFDAQTGLCRDPNRLVERFVIPLDEPKLALLRPDYHEVHSRIYQGPLLMLGEPMRTVDETHLDGLRQRLGARFEPGRVGYAAKSQTGNDTELYAGYSPQFDYNNDGIIDERDERVLQQHLGRRVRQNVYVMGYFGGDWVSAGVSLHPEHPRGLPAIVDYTRGAGYDAETGRIRLFDTPGPDERVWVEYHYDKPADAGVDNIRVHLYREAEPA